MGAHNSLYSSKKMRHCQAHTCTPLRSVDNRALRTPFEASTDLHTMDETQQRIDSLVKAHEIVLFMKGNAAFPMCGFSGRALQILKACGVESGQVKAINVLEDPTIRQGIKDYSNWPTIPQLFVRGEFVGGSDIMAEMYESGELQQVLAPSQS